MNMKPCLQNKTFRFMKEIFCINETILINYNSFNISYSLKIARKGSPKENSFRVLFCCVHIEKVDKSLYLSNHLKIKFLLVIVFNYEVPIFNIRIQKLQESLNIFNIKATKSSNPEFCNTTTKDRGSILLIDSNSIQLLIIKSNKHKSIEIL